MSEGFVEKKGKRAEAEKLDGPREDHRAEGTNEPVACINLQNPIVLPCIEGQNKGKWGDWGSPGSALFGSLALGLHSLGQRVSVF